ncbi:MAG: stage II sporulation protein D [Paraclostridium sp.]
MKNPFLVLAGTVACAIIVPVFISVFAYNDVDIDSKSGDTKQIEHQPVSKKDKKKIKNYETVDKESPIIKVYNHKKGVVESMDIEEYLCGVLSGEMSASFNIEALKAQAIAARTFTIYNKNEGKKHKNAVVCTDFKHCQEYKSKEELNKLNGDKWMKESYSKIEQAVKETKGQILVYDDSPILPLYFSTSSGSTENSEEVFSAKYPYLRSVESPYDKNAPKFASNVKINNSDFIKSIKAAYPKSNIYEGNLSEQIKILGRSQGGSVDKIKLGNVEVQGVDVRKLFNLNSANFDLKFNDTYVDIVVKGYGHGVGMSQWGAEGMANEGYLYYDILTHYYTDTYIKDTY